jgi:hypothetical protein
VAKSLLKAPREEGATLPGAGCSCRREEEEDEEEDEEKGWKRAIWKR